MSRLSKSTVTMAFLCGLLMPITSAYSAQVSNEGPFNTNTLVEMTPLSTFQLVGTATMKWLWLDIYQAQVLTPTGTYAAGQRPLSLSLLYKRSISAEQLIQSTIDEWERQGIKYHPEWVTQLGDMWPDVVAEDELILYVDRASISHFFYNNKFIGAFNDTAFSSAFSAIWLSENTLKPKLRNQLIGLQL
jgi:hypothetical protein